MRIRFAVSTAFLAASLAALMPIPQAMADPAADCTNAGHMQVCPDVSGSTIDLSIFGPGSTTTVAGTPGTPAKPCQINCVSIVVINCTTAQATASDGGIWQEADNCIPSHVLNCVPPDQAYSVATLIDGVQINNSVMCRPPTNGTLPQVIQSAATQARDSLTVVDAAAIVQPGKGIALPVTLPAFFQAGDTVQPGATATVGGVTATITLHDPTYIWDYGDGTAPYETLDQGGPWPTGKVTHKYLHPCHCTVSLNVRWQATMTITGAGKTITGEIQAVMQANPSTAPITIVEAHALLVN